MDAAAYFSCIYVIMSRVSWYKISRVPLPLAVNFILLFYFSTVVVAFVILNSQQKKKKKQLLLLFAYFLQYFGSCSFICVLFGVLCSVFLSSHLNREKGEREFFNLMLRFSSLLLLLLLSLYSFPSSLIHNL